MMAALGHHRLEIDDSIEVETTKQAISYSVGDWVLVTYDGDGQAYPGEITYVDEMQVRINVMEKAGGNFKWPKHEDNIYYTYENIIKPLNPPIVVGNRGQFKFVDIC